MRWLILLFLVVAGADCFCQVNDYPFAKLDLQDGLSDNYITTILRDSRGYLWFGTRLGLNRYDGYSFKIFRHDDADPMTERFVPDPDSYLKTHHLSRFGVVGIIQGKDGDFYFVYGDSGVFRFVNRKIVSGNLEAYVSDP